MAVIYCAHEVVRLDPVVSIQPCDQQEIACSVVACCPSLGHELDT